MEWEIEKVDMAVPISPSELSIKRKSIYKHGSQNNGPAFPGDDPREFWQRAEDRNRNTACLLYTSIRRSDDQKTFIEFPGPKDSELCTNDGK